MRIAYLAGLLLLAATAQAQVANLSLSPASGSGANGEIQAFTATYSDTAGYADIADSYFLVGNTTTNVVSSCYVLGVPSANALYMLDDAAGSWIGPIGVGSGNTMQNSQCTVYGTG